MGVFSDAQGQLTNLSIVQSGQNSNTFKKLCISSLPASLKGIRSMATEKSGYIDFFKHSRTAYSVLESDPVVESY